MSHELEIINGQASMMYAGREPWHGLGVRVEKEVTADAALKLSGLDWQVVKKEICTKGNAEVDGIKVVGQNVPGFMATVRASDNKVLGVVSDNYQVIQNEEAFNILDTLVGEGLAMFHTAGSIFGGKRVFVTCKLPGEINVGPDKVNKYLALATSHDGSMSLHIKWTPIRVVCWNTMSAAFRIRGGRVQATDSVSIRHSPNYESRIKEIREILGLTDVYYSRVEETFQKLIETPMSEYELKQFGEVLYQPTQEDEQGNPVVTQYTTNKRDELLSLFVHGVGNDTADVKNTRWAALNAVTEQIDHHRNYWPSKRGGNSNDSRMDSVIWGTGAAIKKRALNLLEV